MLGVRGVGAHAVKGDWVGGEIMDSAPEQQRTDCWDAACGAGGGSGLEVGGAAVAS